jgi:hypothetical protein
MLISWFIAGNPSVASGWGWSLEGARQDYRVGTFSFFYLLGGEKS